MAIDEIQLVLDTPIQLGELCSRKPAIELREKRFLLTRQGLIQREGPLAGVESEGITYVP